MGKINNISSDFAISKALSLINKEARLPENVFNNKWDDYLFFEPDNIFDEKFIDIKNILLNEEGAAKIALINLGNMPGGYGGDPSAVLLDKRTMRSEYISLLMGDGSPNNWIFLMDRYVCASDKGNWCIYCEKENDIAVLAVRTTLHKSTILRLQKFLRATSIKAIYEEKSDSFFNFGKLVSSWKTNLAVSYR